VLCINVVNAMQLQERLAS